MISKIHRNGKDEISTIHSTFLYSYTENIIFLASFKVHNYVPKIKFYGFQAYEEKRGIKHWNLFAMNRDKELLKQFLASSIEEVNNYLTYWQQFGKEPEV